MHRPVPGWRTASSGDGLSRPPLRPLKLCKRHLESRAPRRPPRYSATQGRQGGQPPTARPLGRRVCPTPRQLSAPYPATWNIPGRQSARVRRAVPSDPLTAVLVFSLVILGAALQGAAGFGMGLIAAPPLMLIAPDLIPGPLIGAGIVLTGAVAYRDRASIDYSGLGYALVGRALGTVMAAVFLALASPRSFDLAFGLLVVLGVSLSAGGLRVRLSPRTISFAGFLSGLMGTVSSIGGPPMALLYQHSGAAKLRATLAGYFVLGVGFSLLALFSVGLFGWNELRLALILSPAMLLGFLLAKPLQSRLRETMIRPIVLGLSLVSAAWVIWRAL
ncbi:MAG TPA: sulfite exporter TauE/SafE family protein [Myxococcales bacterium]|nr:sulfite exporter TauE/SafE family protein [Myxococcales bacterium]